jgi:hypothetical protein
MTELPEDQPAEDPPAGDRLTRWNALATFCMAVLACLLSTLALLATHGDAAPRVVTPAHAATPAMALREVPDMARPLLAIELVLPHLRQPDPFPRAFAVAVALAAGDAEATRLLLPLAPAAADGAPTLRDLAASLPDAAGPAALVEIGFAPDAGWIARRVAGVARMGASLGAAPTGGLAALRDAAARLEAGDASGAEAALNALPADSAAAIAPWRAGLLRRITADAAAARLSDLSVRRARDAAR